MQKTLKFLENFAKTDAQNQDSSGFSKFLSKVLIFFCHLLAILTFPISLFVCIKVICLAQLNLKKSEHSIYLFLIKRLCKSMKEQLFSVLAGI